MSEYDRADQLATSARGPFPNAEAPAKRGRFNPKTRLGLLDIAKQVPQNATEIVQLEIQQAKMEMSAKAKKGGTAIGLFAGVALFALSMWAVLLAAAILALNGAFAPWLSALIVAGGLLLLTIIAAVVAIVLFKKMNGIMPADTIASVKSDLNAVKGLGKYE